MAGEERVDRRGVGDVERVGEAGAARSLDQRDGLVEQLDPPPADGDLPAQAPELRRDRLADAGARAADHRDPVVRRVEPAHRRLLVPSLPSRPPAGRQPPPRLEPEGEEVRSGAMERSPARTGLRAGPGEPQPQRARHRAFRHGGDQRALRRGSGPRAGPSSSSASDSRPSRSRPGRRRAARERPPEGVPPRPGLRRAARGGRRVPPRRHGPRPAPPTTSSSGPGRRS